MLILHIHIFAEALSLSPAGASFAWPFCYKTREGEGGIQKGSWGLIFNLLLGLDIHTFAGACYSCFCWGLIFILLLGLDIVVVPQREHFCWAVIFILLLGLGIHTVAGA